MSPAGGARPAFPPPGIGALLVILLAAACAPPEPRLFPEPAEAPLVTGYHPYWGLDHWQDYPLHALDQLFFFEVEAGRDGSLADPHGWPEGWSGLLDALVRKGVAPIPTVTLYGPGAFAELFASPGARNRLVEELMALLTAEPRARGLHLDFEVFEPVPAEARDGYAAVVATLRERMDHLERPAALSVFVLATDPGEAYDEVRLAASAHYLVLQGYDLHFAGDARAGPVGAVQGWEGRNLEDAVRRLVEAGIPPGRVLLGLPLYGYEWPTATAEPGSLTAGEGRALPWAAPPDVLPELPRIPDRLEGAAATRRIPGEGRWYLRGDGDGGWIQGWYDDVETLQEKIAWARARGLGGVAFFPLTYAPDDAWPGLLDALEAGRR